MQGTIQETSGGSTIATRTGPKSAPPRRWRHWGHVGCGLFLLAAVTDAARADDHEGEPEDSVLEWFEIEGSVEVDYERQQNFDLDSSAADDVDLLPAEIQLELLFEPNEYFSIFVQPTLSRDFELHEEGRGEDRDTELVIEEAYVTLSSPDQGLSLQVGRQSFEDERQWLYDEDLDAVRGFVEASDLAIEVSISREALADKDLLNRDDVDEITNYIIHATYEPAEEFALGAYGIARDVLEPDDDRLVFLGLQASGTLGEQLTYWLDAGHVRGQEEGTTLRGYGIDLLSVWELDAPLAPHVILGYAFGSGDGDPEDNTDHAFRQTGLQGNEAELGGDLDISYYGEAFDPELSNMSIFSAGLGVTPLDSLSIDLLYHYYYQDKASDELRDSALEAEPAGRSRRLGSEIDLVVGFEPFEDVEVRGFFGYFMPGRAFADGADDALFVSLEVEVDF